MANLLSNLVNSKPKWQSPDPATRRDAVAELAADTTNPQREDTLQQLAQEDPDVSVQTAAIKQLSDVHNLTRLAAQHPKAVAQRLQQLAQQQPDLPKQISHSESLLALLTASALPESTQQLAAQQLSDKARLQALSAYLPKHSSEGPDADNSAEANKTTVTQLLAAHHDFESLSRLLENFADDERLRKRLDTLALQNNAAEARAQQLIERLEKISKHGHWQAQKDIIQACRDSWQQVLAQVSDDTIERMARIETLLAATMSAKQDLQTRAQNHSQPAEDVQAIQQGKQEITEKLSQLADTVLARTAASEHDQPALDTLHKLVEQWKTLHASDSATDDFDQQMLLEKYTQKRQAIADHLDSLRDSAQAGVELEAWLTRVEAITSLTELAELKALRTEFKQLRRRMLRVPPEWIERGEAAIRRLNTGLEDSAAAIEEQIQTVKQLVTDLQTSLKTGESAKAAQLYQQASQLIGRTPMAEGIKKALQAKLKQAQRELKEINKWAHWAHNRDRRKLCEELEALAKDKTPAEEKLSKLQAARKEWKELEAAEYTEKDHAAGKELWGRFNAAAAKVYTACETFVQQRDGKQAKYLKATEKRLEDLTDISGITNDDRLRELSKTANQLRRTLRSLNDLPPKTRGAVAKQIKAALDSSQPTISDWQERNAKRKQRVIEMAKLAVKERELDNALSKIKALQTDWKAIGPAVRKEEQSLWDEFKALSDSIYARLNEKRDSERSELNQAFDQLRAALKEAQNALQQPDDALNEAKATFKKAESAFDEHHVRHKVADAIRRDFERAKRDFEKRLKAQRKNAQQAQLQQLASIADKLNAIELGKPADDTLTGDVATLSDAKLQKAMQKRLDKVNNTQLHADNQKTLEALALEMEVLADIETPAAFKSDRMALQVQRLSNAFGGAQQPSRNLQQCTQAWYAIGPVSAEAREALEKRLQAVLQKK